MQMLDVFLILYLTTLVALPLPLPTPAQIWYAQSEIHALVHFNMATFARDGDPGCNEQNWNSRAPNATGPTSSPFTFQPKKLNVSQWAKVMQKLGAKGAILTAKHGCGHLLWPTETTLPNGTLYPYSVGREKSFVKDDVLALFQNAMSANGIKHGFYYSLTNNFFLNVGDHKAGKRAVTLPGQVNVSQSKFESIALAQVKELWTNYGELGEIWFDGGYTGSMASDLMKVLQEQKNAIGFGGCTNDTSCISPNPTTWIGTESGHPSCPNGIWSTGNERCGDPHSQKFILKTCDTPIQLKNRWFWTSPGTMIRDLTTMIEIYHNTVGSNGVLELDFAIDRDGLVAPEHEVLYRKFGAWIKACYGHPIESTTSAKRIGEHQWQYVIIASGHLIVDRVVIREDIAYGQRIRQWVLEGHDLIQNGNSIGNRNIVLLSKAVNATRFVLTVNAMAKPVLMQFDLFAPCSES